MCSAAAAGAPAGRSFTPWPLWQPLFATVAATGPLSGCVQRSQVLPRYPLSVSVERRVRCHSAHSHSGIGTAHACYSWLVPGSGPMALGYSVGRQPKLAAPVFSRTLAAGMPAACTDTDRASVRIRFDRSCQHRQSAHSSAANQRKPGDCKDTLTAVAFLVKEPQSAQCKLTLSAPAHCRCRASTQQQGQAALEVPTSQAKPNAQVAKLYAMLPSLAGLARGLTHIAQSWALSTLKHVPRRQWSGEQEGAQRYACKSAWGWGVWAQC